MITGSNNPFACEPVVFANANAIVSLGTITRDGNEFTFSVGFVWKINGVTYQNTSPVVLTIAEASEGFQRIDNALLNTSNTIELQQGLESETIALRPIAPDTNIILTSWNISGDAIGDTETPIVGTQFKQKNENQKFNPTLGGTTAVITIQPFGQNYYSVAGPVTGIVGFSKALITASPTAEVPYAGKDFYIENKTDHNVTLKNAFSPVDIPFNFGADLIVPTNGIVWLKYNPNTEKMDLFFKSWSEVDLSTKADLVGGKVPASQLPAYVDDVLEFPDLATFPVIGETGKIYLALDTNKTYRWGGSVYVQIGATNIKEKRLMRWWAIGGTTATSLNQFGSLIDYPLTYTGTKQNPSTFGTTNQLITSIQRLVYRSAGVAGSSCGIKTGRDGVLPFTTYTGYDLIICFDTSNLTSVATSRISAGVTKTITDIGNINPSSLLNSIAVANDTGDTNLWLMHNDASGTCTRVNLGANFPHNTENVFYKFFLKSEPNASNVFWKLERYQNSPILSDPIYTIEGVINSNLPSLGSLCWFVHRDNDTTASAVEVGISYVENKMFY